MEDPKPFNDSVFTTFPQLETSRLILRQTRLTDHADILRIISDPRVSLYTGREPFVSKEAEAAWLNSLHILFPEKKAIRWALEFKGKEGYIGNICFWNLLTQHRRAELGYDLSPDYWNKGLMSEALQIILHYGFTQMNLHSVAANVTPENQASVNLLKKHGFVQEGFFKQNFYSRGSFSDTASFSLLDRNFNDNQPE